MVSNGSNPVVLRGWIDTWMLTSIEGEFKLWLSPVDSKMAFRATTLLSPDENYEVVRTPMADSFSEYLALFSAIDWVQLTVRTSLTENIFTFHDKVFGNQGETSLVNGFAHGLESPSGNHFGIVGNSATSTADLLEIFLAQKVKILETM